MLIVCNGAIKSGSTWLYSLMKRSIPNVVIPEEYYLDEKKWGKSNIDPDKLKIFLDEADYKNQNYVCKSHYDQEATRTLLLQYDDVYILNIKRDLRDVIVSHYYHVVNKEGCKLDFEAYYWSRGRDIIGYLLNYHHLWQDMPGKIHSLSYRNLLEDFDNELLTVLRFLGKEIPRRKLERIKEQTTLNNMSKRRGELDLPSEQRFFRKGITGDWKNHFTPAIEEDFNKVYGEGAILIGNGKDR